MFTILEARRDLAPAKRRSGRLPWAVSWKLRNDLQSLDVSVVEDDRVLDYLVDHPDMIEPLVELCEMAREEFGFSATLELAWCDDPGADYLQVLLRLPFYDEDIGDRLASVWWSFEERGYSERSGWIVLTTDHVPAD